MSMTTRAITIKGKIPVNDGHLDVDIILDLAYADKDDRQYVLALIEHIGTHLLASGAIPVAAPKPPRDHFGQFVRTTQR